MIKGTQRSAVRWIGILAALVTATLLFTTWKLQKHRNPTPPTQPELKEIRVGYIPIAECAHLYVGLTKKYFEREGIRIVLVPMNGGAVILPAVQSGSLDIGFANVASLVVLNSKLPARDPDSFISLAGASYERGSSNNHALLIKRGHQVTLDAVANGSMKVAINTTRNIEELMLRRYLKSKKLPSDRLTIIPMGFPEMLSALDRGDIDVISEVEPFIEPTLRSGRTTLLARQYLEVSPNTVVATYGSTRKWLGANRDIADRFRRAFTKADEFIRNNDAETRQIIGSYTRIAKTDLSIIGMPVFEPKVSPGPLQELIHEMKGFEFIQNEPAVGDIIIDAPN